MDSPTVKTDMPIFEFLTQDIEREAATLFNLTNELLRKGNSLCNFKTAEPEKEESQKPMDDTVSKIYKELRVIIESNKKLQFLLNHLNSIV